MSDVYSSYQLKELFVAAVREGNNSQALALLEKALAGQGTTVFPADLLSTPGWCDWQRTPLMAALDADMRPNIPLDLDFVVALLDMGSAVNLSSGQYPPPLYYAIRSGSLVAVELLLERGADPLAEYGLERRSLLITAIEAGQSAVALQLLELGADPNGHPAWPRPLQVAARHGDALVAAALLERGADVDAQFPDSIKPQNIGSTSYSPSTPALIEATFPHHNAVLALFLSKGASPNTRDGVGGTPLHRACSFAAHSPVAGGERVRLLLEAGADSNLQDQWGTAPLSNLFGYGYSQLPAEAKLALQTTLALLLQHGADPNVPQLRGGQQHVFTPLMQAIEGRDIVNVLLLLRAGAALAGADTAQLWLLAQDGNGELQRELAQRLTDQGVFADDEAQNEALIDAIIEGELERVTVLLDNGAKLNRVGREGTTPLHYAAGYSQPDITTELLRRGAEVDARTSTGFTPLLEAVANGERALSREEQYQLKTLDKDRVDQAHQQQCIEREANWLAARNLATIQFLLKHGADTSASDNWGNNALHLAVNRVAPPVVEALLKAGVSINARNSNNRTPLHELVARGRRQALFQEKPHLRADADMAIPERAEPYLRYRLRDSHFLINRATSDDAAILRLLIAHGADVNVPGFNNFLPLHLAAFYGTPETVQLLLDAGAHPNGLVDGYSALQYVFVVGRTSELLRDTGFQIEQFPGIAEQIAAIAFSPDASLASLLERAKPELQSAACEDAAVLRLLKAAGAQMS